MSVIDIEFSNYSKEEIDKAFDETIEQFKKIDSIDFNRMGKQIEIARKCIDEFANGTEQVILSAPTGFGKSILAFFITEVVRNLTDGEGKDFESDYTDYNRAYILTSNKFLQEQYERDIKSFRLPHAMLKGQANYICNVDKISEFPSAPCKDSSVSKLMRNGDGGKFPCFDKCTYLNARRKAIDLPTTVFNYSYFLTTMNSVYKKMGNIAPFSPRLLTIFDECHVLSGVVNDMFTSEINMNQIIRKTFAVTSIIRNHEMDETLYNKYSFTSEIWQKFTNLISEIHENEDDYYKFKDLLEALLLEFNDMTKEFSKFITPKIERESDNIPQLTDYQKELMDYLVYISKIYIDLRDIIGTYTELGYQTAVIQFTDNSDKKTKGIEGFSNLINFKTMKLQCTDESSLIQKAAISFTKYSILMSATIGNPKDYGKKIGCQNYVAIDIESDFDFSKSPIFMVQPMISMNYKNKRMNMPIMLERVRNIIDQNPDVRGLIHTGNFEIMRELEKLRHPRILTYQNSTEKSDILKLLESQPDAVIAGPSLIEGIDLKDDLCRFMIYAKVPYLSLGDKLIKRKMEIYDGWYDFETMVSFQQGLGRPNRHKTDWCKTYLLDDSFSGFFGRYKIPFIINQRIKETHIDNLDEPIVDTVGDEFEEYLKQLES